MKPFSVADDMRSSSAVEADFVLLSETHNDRLLPLALSRSHRDAHVDDLERSNLRDRNSSTRHLRLCKNFSREDDELLAFENTFYDSSTTTTLLWRRLNFFEHSRDLFWDISDGDDMLTIEMSCFLLLLSHF